MWLKSETEARIKLHDRAYEGAERQADQAVRGEIKWLGARLLPKPIPRRVALETGLVLPETLEWERAAIS